MENERGCVCGREVKEVVTLAFLEAADLDTVTNALIATGRWRPNGTVFFVNGGYRREMVRT